MSRNCFDNGVMRLYEAMYDKPRISPGNFSGLRMRFGAYDDLIENLDYGDRPPLGEYALPYLMAVPPKTSIYTDSRGVYREDGNCCCGASTNCSCCYTNIDYSDKQKDRIPAAALEPVPCCEGPDCSDPKNKNCCACGCFAKKDKRICCNYCGPKPDAVELFSPQEEQSACMLNCCGCKLNACCCPYEAGCCAHGPVEHELVYYERVPNHGNLEQPGPFHLQAVKIGKCINTSSAVEKCFGHCCNFFCNLPPCCCSQTGMSGEYELRDMKNRLIFTIEADAGLCPGSDAEFRIMERRDGRAPVQRGSIKMEIPFYACGCGACDSCYGKIRLDFGTIEDVYQRFHVLGFAMQLCEKMVGARRGVA